jgi:hypothetical protein
MRSVRSADDTLVTALANGESQRQAARLAGVDPGTVARRLREPEFQARLTWAREHLTEWNAAMERRCAARLAALERGQFERALEKTKS